MYNTCVSSWTCEKTVVLVIVYHITCYCILNIITLCLLSDCLWGVIGGLSLHSIQAYLSSIKSRRKSLSLSLDPFNHHSVAIALYSIALNIPSVRRGKGIFDLHSLSSIILICSSLALGPIYKALFLTAYFAFFHLSNLGPSSGSSFPPYPFMQG